MISDSCVVIRISLLSGDQDIRLLSGDQDIRLLSGDQTLER